MDCLFCKIIEGAIPSKKVYEDDACYAFLDINPQAPVHCLVVPKEHIASADAINADNASAVAAMGLKGIKLDKEYPGIGNYVFCADYGLPGTKKLCKNTAAAINEYDGQAVIMSNHGAICYGSSYEEAFEVARTLEEACGKYLEHLGIPAWKEQSLADADAGKDAENAPKADDQEPIWNDDPAIMKFMKVRSVLKPYLDDFAQLAGTSLKVVDEEDEKAIAKAFKEKIPYNPVRSGLSDRV